MSTLELLVKARALIAHPRAWTQGCSARLADGTECSAGKEGACQWCAFGALYVVGGGAFERGVAALNTVLGFNLARELIEWNDRATHTDVLATFDRAIALEPAS